MSDFQLYIMKEREAYLKSLNDNSVIDGQPLTMSYLKHRDPSFNLGSLQNSAYGVGLSKRKNENIGLLNS